MKFLFYFYQRTMIIISADFLQFTLQNIHIILVLVFIIKLKSHKFLLWYTNLSNQPRLCRTANSSIEHSNSVRYFVVVTGAGREKRVATIRNTLVSIFCCVLQVIVQILPKSHWAYEFFHVSQIVWKNEHIFSICDEIKTLSTLAWI